MERSKSFSPLIAFLCLFSISTFAEPHVSESKFQVDNYYLSYICAGEGTPVVYLEPPSGISAEEAFAPVIHCQRD